MKSGNSICTRCGFLSRTISTFLTENFWTESLSSESWIFESGFEMLVSLFDLVFAIMHHKLFFKFTFLGHLFFSAIRKLKYFKNKSVFFCAILVFIDTFSIVCELFIYFLHKWIFFSILY